jgi:hypothetical protein
LCRPSLRMGVRGHWWCCWGRVLAKCYSQPFSINSRML